MKNFILFFLITFCLFSCTIEKRRYFKGYHIARSTGSGTAHSTGSGTGEMGKRGNGEEGKRESGEELKRGSVAIIQAQEPATRQAQDREVEEQQQSGTIETIEPEKAQKAEIVIDEIEIPSISKKELTKDQAPSNEEEQVEGETIKQRVWAFLVAFLATALLIVFIGFQLAVETIELTALILYVFLLITLIPLALLFGILFVIRLSKQRRNRKNKVSPEEYKE